MEKGNEEQQGPVETTQQSAPSVIAIFTVHGERVRGVGCLAPGAWPLGELGASGRGDPLQAPRSLESWIGRLERR